MLLYERNEYDPLAPFGHSFSVVKIDGKAYWVDGGYGTQTPRKLLEFDFENSLEIEYSLNNLELIKIRGYSTNYTLEKTVKGENWLPQYSCARPLKPASIEEIEKAYHDLIKYVIEYADCRDKFMAIGRVTPNGKIRFLSFPNVKPFTVSLAIYDGDNIEQIKIENYEEFIT